jgi:heme exporter protein CcmD
LGYVIAAYAVSIGAVAAYLVHLVRERQALARELRGESAPRSAPT